MRLLIGIAATLLLAGNRPLGPRAISETKVEEASALVAAGRSSEAIALFREAVKLDPRNAVAHNALGSLLNSNGHFAEALPHAEQAVLLDPDNARYRYNRGVVRAEHGRFAEAIADFDAALAAHPDLAYGWLERGAAKLSLNDAKGAREDWRKAVAADPRLIWPRWYEATGDFVEGNYAAAAAGFDAVARAEPGFVPAKVWRTIAHARAGNGVEAPEVASTDWPAPVLDFYRGRITADALLRLASDNKVSGDRRRIAEARFFLGQHALIRGDKEAAARCLRAALAVPSPRHFWRIATERELAKLSGS